MIKIIASLPMLAENIWCMHPYRNNQNTKYRNKLKNVTVILNEFRGIDPHLGGVRLPLNLKSPCVHTRHLPPNIIIPSQEIVKDVARNILQERF